LAVIEYIVIIFSCQDTLLTTMLFRLWVINWGTSSVPRVSFGWHCEVAISIGLKVVGWIKEVAVKSLGKVDDDPKVS